MVILHTDLLRTIIHRRTIMGLACITIMGPGTITVTGEAQATSNPRIVPVAEANFEVSIPNL